MKSTFKKKKKEKKNLCEFKVLALNFIVYFINNSDSI